MDVRLLKNASRTAQSAEISDREYWQQERQKIVWDFLIFFAAVVIVALAVRTVAWFASNKNVSGNNMAVSVQDGDFELMVQGIAGSFDEELPLSADYARAEGGEEILVTSSETPKIQWFVTADYNVNNFGVNEGISPGAYGKLKFWVVPKGAENIHVTFQLGLVPYRRNWNRETGEETEATLLTESDADFTELNGYMQGHILFFQNFENNKYSGLIRDSFSRDITFARSDDGTLQPYPITIYWIWPNTLKEALLTDGDLRYGLTSVCATNAGENELVSYFAEFPEHFLYNYTKPEATTLNQTYIRENQSVLSAKYNAADQEIGDEISYIVAEITAKN